MNSQIEEIHCCLGTGPHEMAGSASWLFPTPTPRGTLPEASPCWAIPVGGCCILQSDRSFPSSLPAEYQRQKRQPNPGCRQDCWYGGISAGRGRMLLVLALGMSSAPLGRVGEICAACPMQQGYVRGQRPPRAPKRLVPWRCLAAFWLALAAQERTM